MAIFGTDFSGGLARRLYQPVNPAGLGRAIAIFVGLVIITQLLQIGVGFGLHAALSEDLTDPEGLTRSIMLGLLPTGLLTAALAWYFASVRRGDPKAVLALRLPDLGPAGWVAIAGGFLVGIHLLFALAISVLGIDPDTKGVVEQAMAGLASDPAYAIVVAGVALAVPLAEEMTFRGQIFAALSQTRLGLVGASVITSLVWASIHIYQPVHAVVGLFVMGLVLSALLIRFGSLWVTFACHAVWNGVSALILLVTPQT